MKTPTLTKFIANSNIDPKLVRATIAQFGGLEAFQYSAPDAARSIDGGFSGFIYHADTVKFTKKNKKLILELAIQQAEDIYGSETDVYQMIASFNCLKHNNYKPSEIAALIHGREPKDGDKADDYMVVFNALAWYAGEEVARAWCDYLENLND